MKKITFSILVLLLIVACSKDESNVNQPTEHSIVGIWKLQKTQIVSGKDNSVISEYTKTTGECTKKSHQEYTTDGKYIAKEFVKVNGNCIEDGSEVGTYSYDKVNKVINYDRKYGAKTLNVEELNTDKLVVWISNEKDSNNDGVIDNLKATFLRQ